MTSRTRDRIAYAVTFLLGVVVISGAIRGAIDGGVAMSLCGLLGVALGAHDVLTRNRHSGDDS